MWVWPDSTKYRIRKRKNGRTFRTFFSEPHLKIEGKCPIYVNVTVLFEVYLRFTCSSLPPSMKRRQSTPKKIKCKSSNIHFLFIFIVKRKRKNLQEDNVELLGKKNIKLIKVKSCKILNDFIQHIEILNCQDKKNMSTSCIFLSWKQLCLQII